MTGILIFMFCFCVFAAWLSARQHKIQNQEDKTSEDFWERERRANATRKKDISQLPLLKVQDTEIPDISSDDEAISLYIGLLRENIKQPMIDLSSYSNTDLKLAYGVGNFKTLSDYDENYHGFLQNLENLALAYRKKELYEPAAQSYELALACGSVRAADFTDLAQMYKTLGETEKIKALIAQTEAGSHPHKSSIVAELRGILETDG